MSSKKEDPQLEEISKKLDVLVRLSALNLVRGMETQKEQVASLSDAGFAPKQIAEVLLTNQNVVSVTLNKIRKERAKVTKEETGGTNPPEVRKEAETAGEQATKLQD